MAESQFYRTEIQKELLLAKIRSNPSLKRIFSIKKDVTKQIQEDLNQRINGMIENFFTMHITGFQGSMKTSLAMEIAKQFDKTFNAKRISFQYEEHLRKFKESNPRQIYQIDEQCFERGTGSRRMIEEIQEHIETLRKRQNSLIIVSPEKKYFSEELFTYKLETIDNSLIATCKYNEEEHEPRKCDCYMERIANIKKAKVRAAVKTQGVYIGFYITEIDWENSLWAEYDQEKDSFMEDVKSGNKKHTDYEQIAKEIDLLPERENYKNKKSLKLLVQKHRPNLTIGETELVVEAICMLKT